MPDLSFLTEIRPFTELERSDRGIEGTDVAIAVAVGGVLIGYCDDYGTFVPFTRSETDAVDKDKVEQLVRLAGEVWQEAAASGG